jgi:glycosyltransferase involved in cell wall biosynthesis
VTRVCHVTTAHPVFDTRIFRRECLSLVRAGFEVTLVAMHDADEQADGVQVVRLPPASSTLERRVLSTRRAADVAASLNADLYHFHDPELIPAMRGLAKRKDRPVVWDAHEFYPSTMRHFNIMKFQPASELAAAFFDCYELEACLKRFAGVVTITPEMAERYRSRGLKTCVVGNPDVEAIADPPRVARAALPLMASSGSQFAARAVGEIADAFALLRQRMHCQLAFWGNFDPPDLAAELQTRALSHGAPAEDLAIGGPYPWKTLVNELNPTAWAGFVLLDPRDRNNRMGLPNRFFEYWATGVPVIATAGTEVARVVSAEGGGVVVDRNEPVLLATAFEQLVSDPARARRMGAAGRAAVERTYNWKTTFQRMLAFYNELGVRPTTRRSQPARA